MSARLAVNVLCVSGKEIGEAIVSMVENWYRDPGQWKAAFEAAIQIIVGIVVVILLKLHFVSTGKRKQMGEGSCHPTSFNGSAALRALLNGRSTVPSGVE